MKRVYTVTGAKGSGKSTAVAQFLRPSDIAKAIIIDTEDSMADILENMKRLGVSFGEYVRMYDRFTKKQRGSMIDAIARGKLPWVEAGVKQSALVQYYDYFIQTLRDVLKDNERTHRYTYLGIDTIEPIEAGMSAWVETHRQESGWSGKYDYGKREVEGVRPLYEGILEACHQAGITHFCLASHLKPVWENLGKDSRGKDIVRRVPNKVMTGGRIVLLSRLSSQMWWLIPEVGNPDGAPAAIRIKARKQLVGIDKVQDEWTNEALLPKRVPHFTWTDVRRYEAHGCDLTSPAPGEVPTKAELDMISEFLNEEQMRLMVLGAERELVVAKQVVQELRRIDNGTPRVVTSGFELPEEPSPQLVARAKALCLELGLSRDNRDEVKAELLTRFPPPVIDSGEAERAIDQAIEEVLGE